MSGRQRFTFLAIAAAILVVAIVVVGGGGDSKTTTSSSPSSTSPSATPTPEVVLEAGSPQKITVTQGDQVRFKVRSAKADEAHLHGYDVKRDIPAGGEVTFSLKATITGIFEIELENAGEKLGELVVEPK